MVFSKNEEEHQIHLKKVLDQLERVGLRVNEAKCSFFQTETNFLGYNINSQGISPPQSRIKCLSELKPPKSQKDIQRILGMFGFYQKCIPRYAEIALPLRKLVNQKTFEWKEEHLTSFNNLKESLENSVRLSFPAKNGSLSITADASNTSIGACLNQSLDGNVEPHNNQNLTDIAKQLRDTLEAGLFF